MAEESNVAHEGKKHKKKRKIKRRRPEEIAEEDIEKPNEDQSDSQVSPKEQSPSSQATRKSPKQQKTNEHAEPKLAAKTKTASHDWTYQEKQRLLEEVRKYASHDGKKDVPHNRVEWEKIKMDGYSPSELHEEFKKLTKRVRKVRGVLEVVEDAIQQHRQTQETVTMKNKLPPKPMNAFMLFCKAKRPSLVSKHPELSFAELHRKLCERWREMPAGKRERYMRKYDKAKEKYKEDMIEFEEKQRAMVKKPLSAFELWKAERQEDGLEEDQSEEDLQEEWSTMPMSMKKGWIQAETSEKERYESEMNSIGSFGKTKPKMKTAKKKSTGKETSTSDELQEREEKSRGGDSHDPTESSSKNTSQKKRKLSTPNEHLDKSPAKKISKAIEGSSEEEHESSNSD